MPPDFPSILFVLNEKLKLLNCTRTKNVPLADVEEARKLRRRRPKVVKESHEVKFDPEYESSMQWTMKYAPTEAGDIIGSIK
jgi:hypothetical protein